MKRILVILMLLALMGVGSAALADNGPIRLGDVMEDFTVTTWDGRDVTLSKVLQEKDLVLINLWATWCGPCRSEFPSMQQAYERYSDQVEVIALSTESTDSDAVLADFVADLGLTFPVGRDTPGFFRRIGGTAIPTTLLVDRYGVIVSMSTGAITDAEVFCTAFELFLGEDYTESTVYASLPTALPDAAPSPEDALAQALNVPGGDLTFRNPKGKAIWPMTVTELDGRSVVASTNQGQRSTTAMVSATVSARAGDAIVLTYKTSTAPHLDLLTLSVNGETVNSFAGENDWSTYAWAVPADGEYVVDLAYVQSQGYPGGSDTVWIDSLALLTGEDAAAALAANPVYPYAEQAQLIVTTPGTRQVLIDDPAGILASIYPDSLYYIVPDTQTASVLATISEEYNPQLALAATFFDQSLHFMNENVTEEGVAFTTGLHSVETTGYVNTLIALFPAMSAAEPAITLNLFVDEENLNLLIEELSRQAPADQQLSWRYADEAPAQVSYTVRYVDQDGQPVPGVMCQVCSDDLCQVFFSDADGVCAFTLEPLAWEIHTLMIPAGYTGDTQSVTLAPAGGGEMVFTLTRE